MKQKGLEKALLILATAAVVGFGLFLQKPNAPSKFEGSTISFLNVGQGDAILIRTPKDRYVLIDGGPDKKILSELGDVLPPTTRTIDTLVLSHPHADHVAGLNYVLDRYQVNQIYLTGAVHNSPDYLEFLQRIKEQNIPAKKSYIGQEFGLDSVDFRFLYPSTDISGTSLRDQNDGSSVLAVSFEKRHY